MKWQKALSVAGLVVVCGVAGYVGGLAAWQHSGGASTASTNPPVSGQTPTSTSPNLPGLTAADAKWVNGILSTPVHDSAGQVVHVSPDKPILVVAYWCPFCHKTLQLLEQNHLLDKVQILAMFFNGSEGGQKPAQVTSVEQAKSLMAQALTSVGIPESKANDVLYALPSDGMDSQIQAVPDLLVPKQGKWYMLKGFIPDVHIWQQALS